MREIIEIVLGKKLNLEKKVVGTEDGKPLRKCQNLFDRDLSLKELDIGVERFDEAIKEYERRYREEHKKEVFENYGYIPPALWITCKLPNGEYTIQKLFIERLVPE